MIKNRLFLIAVILNCYFFSSTHSKDDDSYIGTVINGRYKMSVIIKNIHYLQ